MTGKDNISSTEKLLGVIRKTAPALQPEDDTDSGTERRNVSLLPLRKKVFPFVKSVTVGVVVGHADLTLAMMSSVGERRYQLIDFQKIPLKPEIHRGHAQFPIFLKNALKQFCGTADKFDIWSTIPSARVEIRFVKIPKVPEGQIANAVYWSYKKMVPFDEKEMIFDFELLGEVVESGSRKLRAIAYSAPRAEVEAVKKLFVEIGFALTGLTIVPFTLQNLFRTSLIDPTKEHVCSLYIGQDWSRIDIFSEGDLVLSRDIKTGMNSFIESIRSGRSMQSGNGSMPTDTVETLSAEDLKESESRRQSDLAAEAAGREEARSLFYNLIQPKVSGNREPQAESFSEAEIMEMISPVLDRLVRQVERTLGHFTLHFANKTVGKFYLGGEIGGFTGLVEVMGDQLGFPISYLNPFPEVLLAADHPPVPETISEKDSYVPAVGTALSSLATTPNLMYTYRSKAIQAKIQRTNRIIFAAFCLLTCICLGVFSQQGRVVDKKKEQVARLESQLAKYSPIVDEQLLGKMVAKVEGDKKMNLTYAKRYLGVSLLNELAESTPENIRLIQVRLELGRGIETGKGKTRTLVMEGMVMDNSNERESELAVYVMKLNGSPLFQHVTVVQKSVKRYRDAEVLRFTVKVETI